MHNNYYFLRQLSASLEKILVGSVVSECFSQSKDELILRFETTQGSFYIKASVLPNFSCLSFPENLQRARKNSVDLFERVIGHRVGSIRQYKNERSFSIELTGDLTILFKMHGNRANILVFEKGDIAQLFRNNIEADAALNLNELDREIDWSYENFQKHQHDLSSVYFTFGKVVWQYLDTLGFQSKTLDEKWELIKQVISGLEEPVFYVTQIAQTPILSLLDFGNVKKRWKEALPAANDFYYSYSNLFGKHQEKNSVLAALKSRLQSSSNFYKKNADKLQELQSNNNYKIWADLIMANLHAIKPGTEKITVENFYNENIPIEIKLNKELSPQKNAEVYYRKSKNQALEVTRLEQVLKAKALEIQKLEEKILTVETTDDFKTIKTLSIELSNEPGQKNQTALLPYHEFIFNGFKIWVGRNAESNDVLTLKLGYKEDLWLHAKDVSGSHVIIKHQAGKNYPKDVIERAAQLAAYNSKRKNETLCPVVVTPKKYVRKRKGDPPGAVVVEREEVIMVEPKL